MKEENKEITRITIMAAIVAFFFGIKQAIPDKTFEIITMEFSLKFLSNIFFQLLLWMYLVYFFVLALNYGYKNRIYPLGRKFLFDFIITMTIIITFLTFSIIGVIQLVIKFPQFIQPGWKTNFLLLGSVLISAIFFLNNMSHYIKKATYLIQKRLNKVRAPNIEMKESRGKIKARQQEFKQIK